MLGKKIKKKKKIIFGRSTQKNKKKNRGNLSSLNNFQKKK